MTAWQRMDAIEDAVVAEIYARGYRQVSAGVLWALTVAFIRHADGDIGRTTLARKMRRQLKRLDNAIALQQEPMFSLVEVKS